METDGLIYGDWQGGRHRLVVRHEDGDVFVIVKGKRALEHRAADYTSLDASIKAMEIKAYAYAQEHGRLKNQYRFVTTATGTRYIEMMLTHGLTTLFDEPDLAIVTRYSWHAMADVNTKYARTTINERGKEAKHFFMHKLLTGWQVTDHINCDGSDIECPSSHTSQPR